jgi:D-alanyl-D-alanine carboxypeptidase/D-alanyl-D-alanine-endopeptidase (penicillin-binding protein 4)
MKAMRKLIYLNTLLLVFVLIFTSCSMQKKVAKDARQFILADEQLATAQVGIALYDVAAKKYVYNYQAEKYFIPASNTKIMTCYAAMKYLGDSLVGLRYVDKGDGKIEIEPGGDPTLLQADFKQHPVFDFLKKQKQIIITDENWKENALGFGWSWDDYNNDYMTERSMMPVHGNIVSFKADGRVEPMYFNKKLNGNIQQKDIAVKRKQASNEFDIYPSTQKKFTIDIPFYTNDEHILADLLMDTLKIPVQKVHFKIDRLPDVHVVHSQPTDSLLKIMMHRSDNFFAEQSLLMVSNERLGIMNDEKIIDTLLKTDYKDLPQLPQWVDGSGLSRYNLFSPKDFVTVLEKMKNEFNWNRISTIFPTGNEGTLTGLYKSYVGKIYAKTGTLNNNVALSGFITSNKGHQYIFSFLVSNHHTATPAIRKDFEELITSIIEKY